MTERARARAREQGEEHEAKEKKAPPVRVEDTGLKEYREACSLGSVEV